MAYLNDRVLDLGLNVLSSEATALHICSLEPADFTGAVTTHTLGVKAGISVGAPADGTPNGRAVTVAAITDGAVTANGTASHYAIVDTVNSRLLATGALSASQAVTDGNAFTVGAFTIRIPDAA